MTSQHQLKEEHPARGWALLGDSLIACNVAQIIEEHYIRDGKVAPASTEAALMWAVTELAEAYELLLDRMASRMDKPWVRNNPDSKEAFTTERLAEELGDLVMMALVAGYVEGVDPLQMMVDKLT